MIRYTLRQLEYFEMAAHCRSIAAASQRLNVSQPSISSAIRKLEAELGVDLLIRHHAQGVSLTRAGARFLKEARNLLRLGRELHLEAGAEDAGTSGTLAVGCFATFAPILMPRLIAEVSQRHPAVTITLEEGTQTDLIRLLRGGDIEVALLYDLELPEDIQVQQVARLVPQVLLPASHRLASAPSVRLESLIDEPFILLDIPPSHEYFLGLFRALGLRPAIKFSSHTLETVRGMVGQGLGYSILATRPRVDHTYDGASVVVKPIGNRVQSSAIAIARLAKVRPTRTALSFESLCRERLADLLAAPEQPRAVLA